MLLWTTIFGMSPLGGGGEEGAGIPACERSESDPRLQAHSANAEPVAARIPCLQIPQLHPQLQPLPPGMALRPRSDPRRVRGGGPRGRLQGTPPNVRPPPHRGNRPSRRSPGAGQPCCRTLLRSQKAGARAPRLVAHHQAQRTAGSGAQLDCNGTSWPKPIASTAERSHACVTKI